MTDSISRFRRVVEDEARMEVGDLVVVRWMTVYRSYACLARVTRSTERTIRAELCCETGAYSAGQELVAPRIADRRLWSFNNCALFPETARTLGWRPTSAELAILVAERERLPEKHGVT